MKPSSTLLRLGGVALALSLGLLASAVLVQGFAEEYVSFRDPAGAAGTSVPGASDVSTLHDDLTYVLALAAGYSITDANTLRIWNQLVDSEILTGTQVYSNGIGGQFYLTPTLAESGCGPFEYNLVAWPDSATGTFTSRFGPYSPFFHFPHRTGPRAAQEMDVLHDWGWGSTSILTGYVAYAWAASR